MASGELRLPLHTRDYFEPEIETNTIATTTTTALPSPLNLLDLLSNTLVLYQTVPYLPVSALLNVAATSRSLRHLLHSTPGVFRHLDLTQVSNSSARFGPIEGIDHGGEVWRNVQVDETLTEDDFYAGPLRAIFARLRRRDILQHVNTLVLDGLSVTSEFLNDLLVDPASRVRILSIREVTNLNERKLMQTLRYACRPSRAENTPRLKALYYFGKRDPAASTSTTPRTPLLSSTPSSSSSSSSSSPRIPARTPSAGIGIGATWNHTSQHALKEAISAATVEKEEEKEEEEEDDWYSRKGRIITGRITEGWAETLLDCRASIRFDTVLCTGPRHQNSKAFGKVPVTPAGGNAWGVATFAVGGCASCGEAPEGFTVYGDAEPEALPLLSPLPLHESTVRAATRPSCASSSSSSSSSSSGGGRQKFVPRCLECIRERYCFSCNQWWCESCYQVPSREELMAAQHVQILDENTVSDDEFAAVTAAAAWEQPKVKVRMGRCFICTLRRKGEGGKGRGGLGRHRLLV